MASTKWNFTISNVSFSRTTVAQGDSFSVTLTAKSSYGYTLKSFELCMHHTDYDGSGIYGYQTSPVLARSDRILKTVKNGGSATMTFTFILNSSVLAEKMSGMRAKSGFYFSISGRESTDGLGSGCVDYFEPSTPITVLDAAYSPSILLEAVRCLTTTSTAESDEGTCILTRISLSFLNTSVTPVTSGFAVKITVRQSGTTTDLVAKTLSLSTYLNKTVSSASLLSYTDAAGEHFRTSRSYDVIMTFGDDYENTSKTVTVPIAFANVHMSGKPTGGICFGGFSSAENNDPKFECYFPAYFYGGIRTDEYRDGDVLKLSGGTFYGYVSGSTKNIYFTIPLRKSLDRINSVTFNALVANIANSGGYGITSSSVSGGSNYLVSSVTRTARIMKDRNSIEITLVRSSAWNLTNNNTVSVRCENIELELHE